MQQFNFDYVSSTLRIAAKYDVAALRDWAESTLGHVWPDKILKLTIHSTKHAAGKLSAHLDHAIV